MRRKRLLTNEWQKILHGQKTRNLAGMIRKVKENASYFISVFVVLVYWLLLSLGYLITCGSNRNSGGDTVYAELPGFKQTDV